jgi:hypothetical protein
LPAESPQACCTVLPAEFVTDILNDYESLARSRASDRQRFDRDPAKTQTESAYSAFDAGHLVGIESAFFVMWEMQQRRASGGFRVDLTANYGLPAISNSAAGTCPWKAL